MKYIRHTRTCNLSVDSQRSASRLCHVCVMTFKRGNHFHYKTPNNNQLLILLMYNILLYELSILNWRAACSVTSVHSTSDSSGTAMKSSSDPDQASLDGHISSYLILSGLLYLFSVLHSGLFQPFTSSYCSRNAVFNQCSACKRLNRSKLYLWS